MMINKEILLVAALAFFSTGAWSDGMPSKTPTFNVSGNVALKPGCPGPEKKDDECHKPLPEKSVQLLSSAGAVVATTTTDIDGQFDLQAKPGNYSIKVVIDALYPRCPVVEIEVRKRGVTHAHVMCDSGMR